VAFALQADGWYLRQDIIWHKPNPMPESVTDRCTKSHEYIFLLSKNKKYYYDNEVIKEDSIDPESLTGRRPRNAAQMFHHDAKNYKFSGSVNEDGTLGDVGKVYNKRNKRSVWTITTKPYKEAHFATYPPDLIEPCILAGCPEEVCVKCETPYERKMEVGGYDKEHQRRSGGDADGNYYGESTKDYASAKAQDASETKRRILESMREKKDLGLEKQCQCESNETKAGTVLDPFGGSGTTGLVADRNGRNAILIELNDEYAEMARDRLYNDAPLFVDIE
jgi:DNA modification methylase